MKTIVALFDTFGQARDVVHELENAGFAQDDINLIANDMAGEANPSRTDGPVDETANVSLGAASVGGVIGGALGVMAGLGAVLIPGVGAAVAAGPIFAGLLGAGVGAFAGGLLGALVETGVSEEDAGYYEEGVRRGGSLVAVRTEEDRVERAVQILRAYDAVDVQERAADWRNRGWEGYSPGAQAYTTDQITAERAYYTGRSTNDVAAEQAASQGTEEEDTVPVVRQDV